MKQILDQFLHFLEQGIAAIFRFVHLIWTWSMDQIARMMQAPWADWPLWKQIILIIVIAVVAYLLFIAARHLWFAAIRVLASFARFLGALVYTLPSILLAGFVALAGLWLINNLNPDVLPTLTVFERSDTRPADGKTTRPSRQTTGQGETSGNR